MATGVTYSRERIVLCTEGENAAAMTKLDTERGRNVIGVTCNCEVVGFEEIGKVIMSLVFLETEFRVGVDLGERKDYSMNFLRSSKSELPYLAIDVLEVGVKVVDIFQDYCFSYITAN